MATEEPRPREDAQEGGEEEALPQKAGQTKEEPVDGKVTLEQEEAGDEQDVNGKPEEQDAESEVKEQGAKENEDTVKQDNSHSDDKVAAEEAKVIEDVDKGAVQAADDKPATEEGQAPVVKHNRVESIEAPNRKPAALEASPASLDEHRSNLGLGPSSSLGDATGSEPRRTPSQPGLQADMTQNRHESTKDNARAYQPPPPRSYLQLRAMVLQLPNSSSTSTNNPPTLILEGRTNMSMARRSYYPRITRTLPELQLWVLVLTLSFPASIFSPFQYPPPSMMTGGSIQDGDPTVRAYLYQTTNQLARILLKPHVLQHPATAALIDSDFSYVPPFPNVAVEGRVRTKEILDRAIAMTRAGQDPLRPKKGGAAAANNSTFDVDGVAAALGLPAQYNASNGAGGPYASSSQAQSTTRNPLSIFARGNNASPQRIAQHQPVLLPPGEEDPDEEELAVARNEVTRLEVQFERAARAAQAVVERNGAMSAMVGQLARSLSDLGELDSVRTVAKRLREEEMLAHVAKGLEAWSAGEGGSTSNLSSTLIPTLAYQSFNARTAIDALLRRAAAATHRHGSLVNLVQKRREAERLKRNRGEIRQDEVDWILGELREAQRTTSVLTHHLAGFTETLREDLKAHSRHAHADLQASMVAHARGSLRAQRFTLDSLTRTRDGLVASREGKSIAALMAQQQREREEAESAKTAAAAAAAASADGEATAADSKVDGAQQQHENENSIESEDVRKQEEEIKLAEEEAARRKEMLDEQQRRRQELLQSQEEEEEQKQDEAVAKETQQERQRQEEDEEIAAQEEATPPRPPEKDLPPAVDASPSSGAPPLSTSDDGDEVDERRHLPRGVAQSMYLPGPNSQDRDVFDSAPIQSQQQQQQQPPHLAGMGGMSQSATFSPPRRAMAQYSNPFARMPDSSAPAGLPSGQFRPPGAGAGPQQSGTAPGGGGPGAGSGGPWGGGRGRLSASDAARSLGGRF